MHGHQIGYWSLAHFLKMVNMVTNLPSSNALEMKFGNQPHIFVEKKFGLGSFYKWVLDQVRINRAELLEPQRRRVMLVRLTRDGCRLCGSEKVDPLQVRYLARSIKKAHQHTLLCTQLFAHLSRMGSPVTYRSPSPSPTSKCHTAMGVTSMIQMEPTVKSKGSELVSYNVIKTTQLIVHTICTPI